MPEDRTGLTMGNEYRRGLHAAGQVDIQSTTSARAPESKSPSGAIHSERMAQRIWQKNRGALHGSQGATTGAITDAPNWLGLADGSGEEVELPLRFGIHPGEMNTFPDNQSAAGSRGLQTVRVPKVTVIPRPGTEDALARQGSTLTHPLRRSTDRVLRFRAPAAKQPVVIFSLVGGVGGTSLAAGLTRILASCGERILLADAGGHSLLPHYFGGKGSRQGVVRRFVAPTESRSELVTTLSLNVEAFAWNDEELDRILLEFHGESAQSDRVVWDLGNAPAEWTIRILRGNARVIVPLLPTAKCLMQLHATEALLKRSQKHGDMTRWQYVLNQFDDRDPAQVEMRKRFRAQLGERLLPFTLRSSPLVDEALLCGRTVVDHAPASPLVVDLWRLARSVAGLPQAYPEMVPGAWGES